MSPSSKDKGLNALKNFAGDLKASYGSLVTAQQEDQLKPPTGNLLSTLGYEFGLNVVPRFEAPVKGIGGCARRPGTGLPPGRRRRVTRLPAR